MTAAEVVDVLDKGVLVTLALCRDSVPYLVTMDYAYDAAGRCLYCHCATEGKKLDFLRANPQVCGQVLFDDGYIKGQCEHAFRCVILDGRAERVEDDAAKRRALELMVEHFEGPSPEAKERLIKGLDKVCILRVRIESATGKRSPAKSEE